MNTISKTAKASMKAGQQASKDEVILTDTERLRLLRLEIAAHIYPSSEHTYALLRQFDVLADSHVELAHKLNAATTALERQVADNEAKDATIQNLEEIIVHRNDDSAADKNTIKILAESASALLRRAEAAEYRVWVLEGDSRATAYPIPAPPLPVPPTPEPLVPIPSQEIDPSLEEPLSEPMMDGFGN